MRQWAGGLPGPAAPRPAGAPPGPWVAPQVVPPDLLRRPRRGNTLFTVLVSLAQCRAGGVSLLVAEQNAKFLELGDRVFTVEGGRIAFGGMPDAMRADDGLRRAYFGLGV